MTVEELGARMSAREFMEWLEYEQVHTSESWYQTALICRTLAAVMTGQKVDLETFLPPRKQKRRPQDWRAVFSMFAARRAPAAPSEPCPPSNPSTSS